MGDFSQIKDPFTKNKRGPEKQRDVLRGWDGWQQKQEFVIGGGGALKYSLKTGALNQSTSKPQA